MKLWAPLGHQPLNNKLIKDTHVHSKSKKVNNMSQKGDVASKPLKAANYFRWKQTEKCSLLWELHY